MYRVLLRPFGLSLNVQVSQEVVKRRTVAGHVAVVSTAAGFLVVVEVGQKEDELEDVVESKHEALEEEGQRLVAAGSRAQSPGRPRYGRDILVR